MMKQINNIDISDYISTHADCLTLLSLRQSRHFTFPIFLFVNTFMNRIMCEFDGYRITGSQCDGDIRVKSKH